MTEVAPDDNANRGRAPGMAGSQQSLHEADFITDRHLNWLCGYEGGQSDTATSRQPRCPELMGSRSYNQLSCHVDATLAQIDMEQFCRADIDSILEISAYSNDMYGEQGLFSNISMDSLDCSSFEADDLLPSLDAEESSSGALPPTSEDGAAVTSSDAAAVTTSGHVALVTSDDATDSAPATAPSEFLSSPSASPPAAAPLTSWPEQQKGPVQQQHRPYWPEQRLTPSPPHPARLLPSPPHPAQPAGPRTTWQAQCQSPSASPPSLPLRETRAPRETTETRETTTWRQQCLPPSPPATPEPQQVLPPLQERDAGRRTEPVDVGGDSHGVESHSGADNLGSESEVIPARVKDRGKPPCNDLRRYLLRADTQQGVPRRDTGLPEPRQAKSSGAERRHPAKSSTDRCREPTPAGGRPRGPTQTASAAPAPGVDRGCQTASATGAVYVFPHYTLPGLPFLERSPITIPCRHSPTPAASGGQRAQTSPASSGGQRVNSPAPGGSRGSSGSPAFGGSRGSVSPALGNSRGSGSPSLGSSRGSCSPAPGGYPRVDSPGLNGHQRVNSPLPADYQRVNSPLPAGYQRVNSPLPADYQRVNSPLPADYQRVNSPLPAGYQRVNSPLPADYQRVNSPLPADYQRVNSPLPAGYQRVNSPLPADYQRVNSPLPAGYQRVNSPLPADYQRVNSPLPAGYQRVNSPLPADYQRVNSLLPADYQRVNSPIPTGRLTPTVNGSPQRRPYSCNDIRTAIRGNMSAIRDWRSLRMLLPQEFQREMDRLSGGPTSPDGPSALHVGQCRSASMQGGTEEGDEGAERPSGGDREPGPAQGSTRHATLTSGSSTGSGKSLNHWFCDAADFAAANRKELEKFTGSEETSRTKSVGCHQPVLSRQRGDPYQPGSGKTSAEGQHRHQSVDSGIEMRLPASFGVHSGSDSSRSESPSQARRVIVVHRDSFEDALSLITESVSSIVAYFQSSAISLSTNEPVGGRLLGDSRRSPAVGYLVLDRLCPALYALLGDGLLTRLVTAFGPVHNSVWRLVESVCPPGICPQSLSDLVLKVNNEEELSESVLKFNAFVFGLLNTQALDWWFGHLLSRQTALLKHYSAEALLCQLRRADSHRLLQQLRRLARLGFAVELTFESQLLQQSLWRLGRRLLQLGDTEKKRSTSAEVGARAGRLPVQRARVGAAAIRGKLERRWSGRGIDRELLAALTETLSGYVGFNRDQNDNSAAAEDAGTARTKEISPKSTRPRLAVSEPKAKARDRERDTSITKTLSLLSQSEQKLKSKLKLQSRQKLEPESDQKSDQEWELDQEAKLESDQDQEQEPEQEPAASKARARQLEAWWQRVTRDQRSHQLQPWWERQPEQTPAAGAAGEGRSFPAAESRIPRRVAGTGAAVGLGSAPLERPPAPANHNLTSGRETRCAPPSTAAAASSRRSRPVSEGSLRLRLLKRDKEQANQAQEAALAEAARRGAGQPGTRKSGTGLAGSLAADQRLGKRVRSLVPYHTLNRHFLSYDRHDTLTVVGTADQWLLCARDEQVGLVTRHHVTNVT